jgi:hypothetical protein
MKEEISWIPIHERGLKRERKNLDRWRLRGGTYEREEERQDNRERGETERREERKKKKKREVRRRRLKKEIKS